MSARPFVLPVLVLCAAGGIASLAKSRAAATATSTTSTSTAPGTGTKGARPGPLEDASADGATRGVALPEDATAWSGQGSVVALEREGKIEVRDLSHGGAITARLEGTAPQLLRAGRFLLASGKVVHDLAARRSYPLPGNPVGAARISPDGDAVALALEIGGAVDVFLVELRDDAPRLHRLTMRGGASPRWLPGGRLLYEAMREDGGFGLFFREKKGLGRERPFWETPDVVPPPPPVAAPPPEPPVVQA